MNPQNQPTNSTGPASTPTPAASNASLFGILSYLGPLVIVSLILAKDDPSVKLHVQQGLILFGIEVIASILVSFIYMLWPLTKLVNLGCIILSIIGIIHAAQNSQKPLPLIGQYANRIKI